LLFTWQFAVIMLGMLVIHEGGHLRCMKHYGMKTKGIYLIPLIGAAAVAEDNFPSRRAEATIALAGPLTGAALAAGTGLLYFATRNGAFAAAAAWMALTNLFNLLPVVPLDGGRVVKSITLSIGSRTGLAAVIAGMLPGGPRLTSPLPSRRSARSLPRRLSPAARDWRYCSGCSCCLWATSRGPWPRCTPSRADIPGDRAHWAGD
jgi:hypothetical protein